MDDATENLLIRTDHSSSPSNVYNTHTHRYHALPSRHPSQFIHGIPCMSDAPAAVAVTTSGDSVLLKLKSSRIVKLWSPQEEALLISFYSYFRSSWSLYRPYFNRTISSIKMKYHSASKNQHNLIKANIDHSASCKDHMNHTGSSLLITNKLEAMKYIERLEMIAAGNPALALQLMRICGTLSELNQFTQQILHNLYREDMPEILSSMPPLQSGGAPVGFGAGIAYRQGTYPNCNAYPIKQNNTPPTEYHMTRDPAVSSLVTDLLSVDSIP